MGCCSGRSGYPAAEQQFGSALAQRDLKRYRRAGPDASSQVLLRSVATSVHEDEALLDIGAGVGVLAFELLSRGLRHAMLVDASPAYMDAAQSEADRRGITSRVRCVAGDVVRLDGTIAPADVVTMHRVVCCYPDWAALLARATTLSRRVLALSYPRDTWYVRGGVRLENLRRRIFGNPFRSFLHSPIAMENYIAAAGFERISQRTTPIWCVVVYTRSKTA